MAIEDYKPKFKLKKGDSAPNFMAINQNGDKIELKKIKSKWTILFFYPQDSTPTCTKEACNLRDHYEDLKSLDCSIFGISQDSESSHQKFISKNKLPYDLLVDSDNAIAISYDVYSKKKFMGIVYIGIHRTTYILDKNKKVHHIIYPVVSAVHHQQIIDLIAD